MERAAEFLHRFCDGKSGTLDLVTKLTLSDLKGAKRTQELHLTRSALNKLLNVLSPQLASFDVQGCRKLRLTYAGKGDPALLVFMTEHFNKVKRFNDTRKKQQTDSTNKNKGIQLRFRVSGCRLPPELDKEIHTLCQQRSDDVSVMVHKSDVCAASTETRNCEAFVWSDLPCAICKKRFCLNCNGIIESPCTCCQPEITGLCTRCADSRFVMCGAQSAYCPRIPFECTTCKWLTPSQSTWSKCQKCSSLLCGVCSKYQTLCKKCNN